ncbi:heme oxygenase [Massilia sp. CCM 8694]|uniref:Heme oxygenase n=1 Tax=Massilia genomosp. 1 TaxID=2609280 RepID=A0ABX0MS66_9BURK|nr:heme oxygenase [Massilia genomosp. 1]
MNQHPNRAPGDALSALRIATADRHAVLDTGMPLARPDAGLQHYSDHLHMLRRWLAPLEAWLARYTDGPQGEASLPAVARVALIDADLADPALAGVRADARPEDATVWPDDASAAYRWGVTYVIEGSQLGGAVLYQRLAGPLAPHRLRYLRSGAEGPGPRWRSFMLALRGNVKSEGEIADACRGACDAFDRILAMR